MSREFDVIVFGVTGFAGRLVAEYLAQHGSPDLRWAVAGRSLEKMRQVMGEIGDAVRNVPLIEADSGDVASLDRMVRRTQVVCSTVGPYARFGSGLVASCVEAGTDYCDLTGEVHWVRKMVDLHHKRAEETGARIVHCCGFDSMPSDLGTLMVQRAFEQAFGKPADEVQYVLVNARGGFSGGTVASMLNVLDEASSDAETRAVLLDPYSLNPEGDRKGPDGRDDIGWKKDEKTGEWLGPFVMASVNTRVVRRSNALLGWAYGRDFRYDERMRMGKGVGGAVTAFGLSAGMVGFLGVAALSPGRAVLRGVLPAPGNGPSRAQIENGFFKVRLAARGANDEVIHGVVECDLDPGYGATAIMLAESALHLVETRSEANRGGVLTPASALGERMFARLRNAGMRWEIV